MLAETGHEQEDGFHILWVREGVKGKKGIKTRRRHRFQEVPFDDSISPHVSFPFHFRPDAALLPVFTMSLSHSLPQLQPRIVNV
jgi:hypothetical protein